MVRPRLAASVRAQGFLVLLAKFMVEVEENALAASERNKGQNGSKFVCEASLDTSDLLLEKGVRQGLRSSTNISSGLPQFGVSASPMLHSCKCDDKE